MKTLLMVLIAIIVGTFVGWNLGNAKASNKMPVQNSQVVPIPTFSKEQDLKTDMRKLWEDHIIWTRMWIESEAYTTGEADSYAARLLKNQDDIGNAIKPYYGDDAGNKLTELLKTHITIAVDLVKAAKAEDTEALTNANDAWYVNANEIADFLANANPNWSQESLRSMMKSHLDLTKQEAVNILQKNHEASVSDYDKVHEEILMMSDTISEGIIKQFPEKF